MKGKKRKVSVPIKSFKRIVAEPYSHDKPAYYIYGGLVFTVLTTDVIKEWGREWWKAPLTYNNYRIGVGKLNNDRKREKVILLHVLPDDINVGYHNYQNMVIDRVNGQMFNSFQEFVQLISENEDSVTMIESEMNDIIILKNDGIDEVNQSILDRNHIPAPFSQDVAGWLQAEVSE